MNLYEQNKLINQEEDTEDQARKIRAQDAVDVSSQVEGVSVAEDSQTTEETAQTPVINDRKPVISKTPEWVDYAGEAQQYEQKVRQVSEDVNYGLTVTQDQYQVIANAMANSDDPEATEAKYAQALVYSREYNIDLSTAILNLDSLNKAQFGHSVPYTKAGYKAVLDSVLIGQWGIELSELKTKANEISKAGGNTEGIKAEIKALENVIDKHQDNASRGLGTTLLKLGAQSFPYTARIFLAGGATGALATGAAVGVGALVGGPAGAAAALAAAGTIYQKASMVGGFVEGYKLVKGAQYYDLVEEGVDPEVAEWTSSISAVIQSGVEQFLGIEAGLNKAISHLATGTTTKILAGMYAKGTFRKIAGVAAEYFKTGVSEGLEEFIQQLTEDLTNNVARELSGIGDGKVISKKEIKNAMEAFAGGFGASLVLGILPTAINTNATIQYAKDLRTEAQSTDSKKAFINAHKGDAQFEGFSSKAVDETLSQVYDNARESGYDPEASQISDKEARTIDVGADMGEVVNTDENGEITGIEKATSKQPTKPLSRTDDGRIVTMESEDVRENADGSEKHLLILGGTDSEDEYGRIEYTLDGNKVRIDRVATFQGYEDIQADGIKELMRRYEGYELSWDPLTEAQEKIKQDLIDNNPLGSDKGLNWFDGSYDVDTAVKVGNVIGRAFKNLTQDQKTTAAVLLDVMADSQGMTTSEYLKNYVQEFGTFDEAGKRGGFEILSRNENGIKAAIYAGENADFSTFAHESFHLLRQVSNKSQDLAKAFADAAGTDQFRKFAKEHWNILGNQFDNIQQVQEAAKSFSGDGNWTRDQEELAAHFFEAYLQEGKTFSSKLKNLFHKISEWFSRLYNTLKHKTQLNDDIIRAYDSMLEGNRELQKENEVGSANLSTSQDEKITIGTAEEPAWFNSSDSLEADEDNGLDETGQPLFQSDLKADEYTITEKQLRSNARNFNEKGTHLAPNGNISNLSYEQWVTVRTPSFKRWFGDWENDPANASKILDENGEPRIMYHGTDAQFEIFERKKARSSGTLGNGFYFTAESSHATQYGNPMAVFLNIRRPVEAGFDAMSDIQLRNFLEAVEENEDYGLENYGNVSIDKVMAMIETRDIFKVLRDVNATAIGNFAGAVELFNSINGTSYDGIVTPMETTVFRSEQIKSATKNKGFFDSRNPNIFFQAAYHGSGAAFSEFDNEKIGSGQGSQVFGYGHYVSDSDIIGKDYAALSAWDAETKQKDIDSANEEIEKHTSAINGLNSLIESLKDDSEPENDQRFLARMVAETSGHPLDEVIKDKIEAAEEKIAFHTRLLAREQANLKRIEDRPIGRRNLYKVEIPDNNGKNYLDLDKEYKLSELRSLIEAAKEKMPPEERKHFVDDYGLDPDKTGTVSGQNLYDTLSIAFGRDDKETSSFLHEHGYTGNVYDAGQNMGLPDGVKENTKNYVIFDPKDIGIVKSWQYDTDEEAERFYQNDIKDVARRHGAAVDELGNISLYTDGEIYTIRQKEGMAPVRMTADMLEISDIEDDGTIIYKRRVPGTVSYQFGYEIDQIFDYAAGFDTYQEFEDDVTGPLSVYSEEELEGVDLMYVWNKAHNLVAETDIDENAASYIRNQGYVSPVTEAMDEDQKTAAYRARISTDEGVKGFIGRLREIYSLFKESGGGRRLEASNDADFEAMAQDLDLMQRVYREASPFIKNLMFSKKDEISDKAILEVRGMMLKEENQLMYRDLYADVMLDPNLKSDIYNRQYTLKDPGFGYETKSIAERARMFSKQDTADWVKKVQSGQVRDAELKKHISNILEERDQLKEQLKEKNEELSVLRSSLDNDRQKQLKMLEDKAEEAKQLRNFIQKVQEKLSNGRRMTAEEFKKINSAQERIALLNEEMKKLRRDDRLKATAERREAVSNAVNDLRKQYSDRQHQAAQAKALQEHKEQLARIITGKRLNDDVNWEQRREIEAIAAAVDPHNRRDKIRVGGVLMTVNEVREKISSGEIPLENVTDYMLTRLTKTPLNEWTVAELEEMAEYVQDLRAEGKQIWQAKVDKRNMDAQRYRNQILRTVQAHRNHPDTTPIPNTPEAEKIENSFRMKMLNTFNKTLNMDRKAQKLDNYERGTAWRLLVDQRRRLDDKEYLAVQARIQPIMDLMKELKVKPEDLYQKLPVSLDSTRSTVMTVSDLAYALYAELNKETYEAVAYGDLVTQEEKDNLRANSENDDVWNDMISRLGDDRYEAVKSQAQVYFDAHPEQFKIFNAIDDEWQKPENFERSNAVTQEEYNVTQEKVDHYMRIYRTQRNGSEIAQTQAQDMMAKYVPGAKSTPKKGQTKARITITPSHQTPTRMDMLGTWMKSVEENEHLVAFTPWVRMMNRIFKNRGSEFIRDEISATFGKGMWNDLTAYISEVAVPTAFRDETDTDQILRTLRGGIYTGYLGAKVSSVVLQGISSPMPFLREVNPLQLARGILKFSTNPKKSWAFITELSPFMKRRSISPIAEEIRSDAANAKANKVAKAYHEFQDAVMQPLEWVDRWAVAGGWLACYEKKLSEFEFQNDIESMKKAAHYADTIVYQTQPNGVTSELSPMFKPKGAAWKTFVQFQTSLNTIWQNVTFDTGTDFMKAGKLRKQKDKKYRQYMKRALMTLAGYAFAGLMLQLVTEGFDDDDDNKDKARKLVYGSMTQFVDSIPLIGDLVNAPLESAVTGERSNTFSTSLYPALDKIANGMAGVIAGKDKGKAWLNIAKGAGLMTGFPVNGLNEWIEAISGKPEALLGRD